MTFRIETSFDPRRFESNMKRQVNDGLRRYAAKLQAALDGLHQHMAGQPIEQVKAELRSTWRAATGDGDITDPELTRFAQAISDGQRVVLETSQFRI
jgi:hypothetical protein